VSVPGRRYHAPAADRAVLAVPPSAELPGLVAANRRTLTAADVRIDGVPLSRFREQAKAEVLAAARRYLADRGEPVPDAPTDGPLVATGHQPELFHPGVWVKNFALNRLAREVGGSPLHLIVDNDTLKSAALKFPTWDGPTPAAVRLEGVPFDAFAGEVPYEGRGVLDPALFRTFSDRAGPLWRNWGFEPMLPRVWREVVARPASDTLAERFAAARRTKERAWGCHNLELPVSRLAATAAFRHFACQILLDLPRFAGCYNRAIRAYRERNHVKSANHPAPELSVTADRIEAPFWRVAPGGRTKAFHAPGTPPDFADLRPRALTLTLFARVALSDLFIHGIGGGKYDEVTDAIIADYFGLAPPAFQVLSATVHLPLPTRPPAAADLSTLRRRERDAHWNPHRHLPPGAASTPAVRDLLDRRTALLAAEPQATSDRRRWFRDLRAVRDGLYPYAEAGALRASEAVQVAETAAGVEARLTRRDLSWVLYPEETLTGVMQKFL